MNLAIDIGNTRTKLGVFDGQQLVEQLSWENWNVEQLNTFITNLSAKKIIYSTVRGIDPAVEDLLKQQPFSIQLTAQTPLPFINTYHTPETLGKDRLAAVAGVLELFPKENCLVVDAGTCITYDLLTADRHYLGGNISPGLTMRLRAMHEFTARLPLIERGTLESDLGKSTEAALRIGAEWGAVLEMEGVFEHFKKKFDRIKYVLTGGDADFFVNHLKSEIFVNQNLVLLGLNKILTYNVQLLE